MITLTETLVSLKLIYFVQVKCSTVSFGAKHIHTITTIIRRQISHSTTPN